MEGRSDDSGRTTLDRVSMKLPRPGFRRGDRSIDSCRLPIFIAELGVLPVCRASEPEDLTKPLLNSRHHHGDAITRESHTCPSMPSGTSVLAREHAVTFTRTASLILSSPS